MLPISRAAIRRFREDMVQPNDLDDLDRSIIALLTEDGRLSASEISTRIGGVSERTVRNRISALLQNRHIVIGAIPDPRIPRPWPRCAGRCADQGRTGQDRPGGNRTRRI